jgi:transcriptional/translational regulatory protein YebC/TACO1
LRGHDGDKIFEAAVEAGADDVLTGDDAVEIIGPIESFKAINDALEAIGVRADEASLQLRPTTTVELSPEHTLQVMRVIEGIEELDDVQHVYSALQVTDEAVALLETA